MSSRLKALVHGDSGVGKSWLGASTPGPRLILDVEGGSQFAKAKDKEGENVRPNAISWDPMTQQVPTGLDSNDSVFVRVHKMDELGYAMKVLQSGQHEFNSVVLDSLTDIQLTSRYAIRDEQKNTDVTDMRSWGQLLDEMIELCRSLRDLTDNPIRPLWTVLVIAGSELTDGQWSPQIQGGIRTRLGGFFDVVGFLQNEVDYKTGSRVRRMHLVQSQSWKAKDRTDELVLHYGDHIDNPDVRDIMAVLNA